MATEEGKLFCIVRRYHAYKDVWDPVLEHQFRTKHQKHNSHDKYAMAVVPVDASASRVGHFLVSTPVASSFSRSPMVHCKTKSDVFFLAHTVKVTSN